MPTKVLGSFSVRWMQVLNEQGKADAKLMPKLSSQEILRLHQRMVFSRIFDDKCIALQRQGRIGTYASHKGQEAAQVGSALALKDGDWLFPSFRENSALIARGVPAEQLLIYWAGDESGEMYPGNNFTVSIPVGTQILHGVGAGWGLKLQGKKAASLVYFGDGATSKGDFHEGMNWAGVFKVPCVFFCQNNQYAISLPFTRQTAAKTIAQKAIGYGFPGIRVDGNDVFAVYSATKEALEKARSGGGPTLIEAFTYRMEHHTTADDSTRYRSSKEVAAWKGRDPIERLEKWMRKKGLLTVAKKKKVLGEARKTVEKAVRKMESSPAPGAGEMFKCVFASPTWNMEEQKKEVLGIQRRKNG